MARAGRNQPNLLADPPAYRCCATRGAWRERTLAIRRALGCAQAERINADKTLIAAQLVRRQLLQRTREPRPRSRCTAWPITVCAQRLQPGTATRCP